MAKKPVKEEDNFLSTVVPNFIKLLKGTIEVKTSDNGKIVYYATLAIKNMVTPVTRVHATQEGAVIQCLEATVSKLTDALDASAELRDHMVE